MTTSSYKINNRWWFIPVAFSFLGFFYLLHPVASGVAEVLAMDVARNVFLPIDWLTFALVYSLPGVMLLPKQLAIRLPDMLFAIIFLLYGIYVVRIGLSANRTNLQKRVIGLPLVILPVIWVLLLPLGPGFFGEKRVNSIVLGGEIKVILAGGPEILREDAHWLAQNATSDTPPWEEWPESIQKLGYGVDIQTDKQLIEVELGSMCGMCAYLGFIIQTGDATIPLPSDIEEFGDPYPLVYGIYFVVQ